MTADAWHQASFVEWESFLCLRTFWVSNIPRYFYFAWVDCSLKVTCNDSVIYVTAHRCAGGLKEKLNLRSASSRHRHFVGFLNVPHQAPTRGHPFYTVIPRNRPIYSPFTTRWRHGRHILDLTPRSSGGELCWKKNSGAQWDRASNLLINVQLLYALCHVTKYEALDLT